MTRDEAIKQICRLKDFSDQSWENNQNRTMADGFSHLAYCNGVEDCLKIIEQIDEPKWHRMKDELPTEEGWYLISHYKEIEGDNYDVIYYTKLNLEILSKYPAIREPMYWQKITPYPDV